MSVHRIATLSLLAGALLIAAQHANASPNEPTHSSGFEWAKKIEKPVSTTETIRPNQPIEGAFRPFYAGSPKAGKTKQGAGFSWQQLIGNKK